jgi:hypothetical protein
MKLQHGIASMNHRIAQRQASLISLVSPNRRLQLFQVVVECAV